MVLSSPLALLLLGLATIVWATHIVVENAVSVARHHRVSDFFIGVVVLAVGSDLPELVVTLHAAFRQLGGQETENLIIGNAIGSCFGQLGLVIGLGGLIRPVADRPGWRYVVGVNHIAQYVPLADADVLELVPEGVGDVVGPGVAQRRG